MSLISRIEITNYVTEGLSERRRIADWRPLLTGITLRLDGLSSLVNITNGGGKTSIADIALYTLSREPKLLKRVREKCAPKGRGYTHARIEFRDTSTDNFVEPSLLEIDPENLPGETHVVGVLLNDDVNEPPIFYVYSGTLEDSPCYVRETDRIVSVADSAFISRTRSLPGCKWNKHANRREWEDQIGLFISFDVVRRNVKYQLDGSDDKNASFFAIKQRGGESYERAFFKSVIAPDLLTNLLSTWAEEDEQTIEDTLHLSLSRIVETDKVIAKQNQRLLLREDKLKELAPLLDCGRQATEVQKAVDEALRSFRKDAALVGHFGNPHNKSALPGLPRSPETLKRDPQQDARVLQVFKGMVLSPEPDILVLDKTLAELTGVDVRQINQAADRKNIRAHTPRSQVIDFNCDFENMTSGTLRGGHYRKGYSRDAAMALPALLKGTTGARVDGLEEVLGQAFDIAEAQIDTNPASMELRRLQRICASTQKAVDAADGEMARLVDEIKGLDAQLTTRAENQAAWEEFQSIAAQLPDALRTDPAAAKAWLDTRMGTLRTDTLARTRRHTTLDTLWKTYCAVMEQAGLEGVASIQARYRELHDERNGFEADIRNLAQTIRIATTSQRDTARIAENARKAHRTTEDALEKFNLQRPGYDQFRVVFGDIHPGDVNPQKDLDDAQTALDTSMTEQSTLVDEIGELERLKSQSTPFLALFGKDSDPLTCNPILDEKTWAAREADARESLAPWAEKVEALDNFEDLYADVTPSQWLQDMDARREALNNELAGHRQRKVEAQAEIDAIDQMGIVDDGIYAAAWRVLDQLALPCRRLFSALTASQMSDEHRKSAMSALSGLLSAPVFANREALQQASEHLARAEIAVPLIEESALIDAMHTGQHAGGDIHLVGYIAGRYSKQVRILLEPGYAEEEKRRLSATVKACDTAIQKILAALPGVLRESDVYKLALKAQEAVAQHARTRRETYKTQVIAAQEQLKLLSVRTTAAALEVLRCAKVFIERGGEDRLSTCLNRKQQLDQDIKLSLQPSLKEALARASFENLTAVKAARAFVTLGGESAQTLAQSNHETMVAAFEEATARAESALDELQSLQDLQGKANLRQEAFATKSHYVELARLHDVLDFDSREEDKAFMASFKQLEVDAGEEEERTLQALRVNFERAATFKSHMSATDQQIQLKLSAARVSHAQQKTLVENGTADLKRMTNAEIPAWQKIRLAIHELAWEIGRRASNSRTAASAMKELIDGQAVVEVHPLFHKLSVVAQRMKQDDSTDRFIEAVNEVTLEIQGLDFEASLRGYETASQQLQSALQTFETRKRAYCEAARGESSVSETALNPLEIDEIEQATPARLQALAALFERLRDSIGQDRAAAEKSREAASQAHEAALGQLASLIRLAQTNLNTLDKVMARYPGGRFFVTAQIAAEDRIKEILLDLKEEVERIHRDADADRKLLARSDDTRVKQLLRDTLIDRVFQEPAVDFVNAGIWGGKRNSVTKRLSTGQMVALEFMWIVRQAEFEIERGLTDLTNKQAAKSRTRTNRVILIDGIFSSLSDRRLIKEAMNGLKDLGGNFQIIGLLHSTTWVNDYSVFPVYHVGKKLDHPSGKGLVTFSPGRELGSLAMFSSFAQSSSTNLLQ